MKAAIYCRLSEEDRDKKNPDDDSNSIQNQKKMLIDYAMQNDWEIYNIYSDDDYSGSDRNRPEFNRMIADAEEKKFDIILCKAQSRFTRELELVEKYINYLLPLWGIRFIGLVDNADTENVGNKKARQITGLTNEWYIEDLSNDIRKVLHSKVKQGIHIGSSASYGYVKDPACKGHIIVDPEAAEVVKQIFQWSYEGYSIAHIVRMLNDAKIPNPSTYKELKGMSYRRPNHQKGSKWQYFSVQRILHNEVYIGNMVQGRQKNFSYKSQKKINIKKEDWVVVENTHEPIINRELFFEVQRRIGKRTRRETTPSAYNENPLARKLKCAECGRTLRSCNNGHGVRSFRCPSRFEETDSCAGCYISYRQITAAVLQELNKMIDIYLDTDALAKRVSIQQKFDQQKAGVSAEINAVEKSLKQYSQKLKTLYKDRLDDIITVKEFAGLADTIRQEQQTLEKRRDMLLLRQEEIDKQQKQEINKEETLKQYIDVKTLDRAMVENIIDYILVTKKNPETKQQQIEIFWNF